MKPLQNSIKVILNTLAGKLVDMTSLADNRILAYDADTDQYFHVDPLLTVAPAVTYENLLANGDVGTGATQVAQGDHLHDGRYPQMAAAATISGLWNFTTAPTIGGSAIWTTASFNPANYVPYSGATGNVDLGGYGISANYYTKVKPRLNVPIGNLGDPTVEEMALFHGQFNNKFRFAPADVQEESTDGVTWVASSRGSAQQLKDIMLGEGQTSYLPAIPPPGTGNKGYYRLTWDNTGGKYGYVSLNSLYIYNSTNANAVTFTVEQYHNTDGWSVVASGAIGNWPGHTYIPHSGIWFSTSPSQIGKVRISFGINSAASYGTGFDLYAIEWFGGYPAGRRNVEYYDSDRNVYFPTEIYANNQKVWTAGNDGAGSGLDADVLDGFQPDSTAAANTVVVRNGSGYIFGRYFNSDNGQEASVAASYIYDTGDGYFRKKSLANVKSEIVTSASVIAGLGYTPLSSFTETDTLATVTGRGATTYSSLSLYATSNTEYGTAVVGTAGGSRSIFLAGQSGFSNGFTVGYNGTNMVYTMNSGNLTVGGDTTVTGTLNSLGQFIFESNSGSNYDEGIRLNLSTSGWAGAAIGGARGTINGISGGWWLARNPNSDFVIAYNTSDQSGGLFLPASGTAISFKSNAILHSVNYSSYALSLSGGTITGKTWLTYGNTAAGGYSWVDAAITTNSIEIVNSNGSSSTVPTLAFHTYGSGGPQFRLSSDNILWIESAGENSARTATFTSSYFNSLRLTSSNSNGIYINGNNVWHSGNDGSGSGLDADTLDGYHSSAFALRPIQSESDFPNGTLVQTNIDASIVYGASFILEATGKSYSTAPPFSFIVQGYIYANTFINTSGVHFGLSAFSELKILNYNGNLAFWWPRYSYWNSFQVTVRDASGSSVNRTVSVVDSVEPASSKKVTVQMVNTLNSSNFTSYSPSLIGAGASGTWGINISGDSNTLGGYNESNFLRFHGTYTGALQDLQATPGTIRFDQLNGNGPSGYYNFGGILSFKGTSFGLQLYGSHTGDLAFKTQWSNDEYSGWRTIIHTGNIGAQSVSNADTVDGQHFSWVNVDDNPTWLWGANSSGTAFLVNRAYLSVKYATTLSTNRHNYKGNTDGAVVGQLMWKNYGNGHTIFDASNGTSPDGTSVSRVTPQYPVDNANGANTWGESPVLMGWNGSSTYGVKVDYANKASLWYSSSHPANYWLVNNWDGTYWYITSNHSSPVRVGYSDNSDTLDGRHWDAFAAGVPSVQSMSFDTIKQPGLYHYDNGISGTSPNGQANYRSIEIGNYGRYTQMAFPWNSDEMYFRKQQDSTWGNWNRIAHSGNLATLNGVSLIGTGNIVIDSGTPVVTVAQAGHGFSVGNVIRVSGANTFTKAQANTSANAEVIGYVITVIDANNFKYVPSGYVIVGIPAVAAGTVLYLDPNTAGALTATEPTAVGQISKPLMVVVENGAKAVFNNFRGMEISAGDGYVLTSTTVNGKALSGNITLVIDSGDFTLSDNTTNNSNTSRHGLLPKLSGNQTDALRGDGTWGAVSSGSAFWGSGLGTPTRTSSTTFTMTGDYTAIFAKGLIIKWTESSTVRVAMVSIPSTYGSPNTTVTIIGDTMTSIDAGSLKYCLSGVEVFMQRFAVAGNISAAGTDIANSFTAMEPYRVIGSDIYVGTAGTTGSMSVDLNKNGTTMFTTKPSLATTAAYSPTPFTADSGSSLALGDKVTLDIDAVHTTAAIDLYVQLYLVPSRYLNL